MEKYGEILDGGYEPENDYVYNLFVNYFNNPTMNKIKNQGKFSLYACKIHCLLNNDSRYIIVVTNIDNNSIGTVEELSTIKWVSLQTRTLKDKLPTNIIHGYNAISQGPLTAIIRKTDSSKTACTYSCDNLPLIVTLLHTDKKDANTYQQKGTVIAAIETYETIITFS